MTFSRRRLFAVTPVALAATVFGIDRALAQATTDLAITCDAAAGPAITAAGKAWRAKTGVRVRVFPTAPGLVLPQLQREIQNDVIVTQIATIDLAQQQGLVAPDARSGSWRNPLVIAAANAPAGPPDSFAVPDVSPASDIDGPTILQRLHITPAKTIGVIDTGAVAWTLATGGARQGILHQTELIADNRLRAVSTLPDTAWPSILYAAAVTKLARRGDPGAFVKFLTSPEGQSVLQSAGLEVA